MRKICIKCKTYHDNNINCKSITIKCKKCGHEQKTRQLNIDKVKCGVCNRYDMVKE